MLIVIKTDEGYHYNLPQGKYKINGNPILVESSVETLTSNEEPEIVVIDNIRYIDFYMPNDSSEEDMQPEEYDSIVANFIRDGNGYIDDKENVCFDQVTDASTAYNTFFDKYKPIYQNRVSENEKLPIIVHTAPEKDEPYCHATRNTVYDCAAGLVEYSRGDHIYDVAIEIFNKHDINLSSEAQYRLGPGQVNVKVSSVLTFCTKEISDEVLKIPKQTMILDHTSIKKQKEATIKKVTELTEKWIQEFRRPIAYKKALQELESIKAKVARLDVKKRDHYSLDVCVSQIEALVKNIEESNKAIPSESRSDNPENGGHAERKAVPTNSVLLPGAVGFMPSTTPE